MQGKLTIFHPLIHSQSSATASDGIDYKQIPKTNDDEQPYISIRLRFICFVAELFWDQLVSTLAFRKDKLYKAG